MTKRKRSASREVSFTRSIKRDRIKGRQREGRPARRATTSYAGVLGRLRRLEFAVLALMGVYRKFDLDQFAKDVLSLEADAQIESRGGHVRRGEVQVPYERGTSGQTPREAENLRRSESGDEEGELSPFPPGEPDEEPR